MGNTRSTGQYVPTIIPGLVLCLLVTGIAYGIELIERILFGRAWLEALVLAILCGTVVRSFWNPGSHWRYGITFSAKYLLEIAVVLLGASVTTSTLLAAGIPMLTGIVAVVIAAILMSFGISRAMGLPVRMALLVACGNSICGNSAIAVVAPVIGAESDEVASSIAFTAVLGVIVVLGLPLAGNALNMSALQYGKFAGLTVYAVPQVIAATAPFGPAAVQMGMLVKLVRVLMLGPVCLALSLIAPRLAPKRATSNNSCGRVARKQFAIGHLIPWFILGFLAMIAFHSVGWIPENVSAGLTKLATILTVVSMAALGLGVNIRTVVKAGKCTTLSAILSLLALGIISYALCLVI